MDLLSILLIIPLLIVVSIILAKNDRQVKIYAATGFGIQLLYSIFLTITYFMERAKGSAGPVLMEFRQTWFSSLNIEYHTGVDGIAIAMILLTAVVIFAGIFASWDVKMLTKEFFISLTILSMASFGFFISLNLFVMFIFYELAVIPMYLLIGIWGSGKKEFAAMKLTLMLMGGSALLIVSILGIYFNSTPFTFDMMRIAEAGIPIEAQRIFFPLTFVGFGIMSALFPLHSWSPDGHSSAPTAASMLHAGVLMKLGGYGCLKAGLFLMPEAAREMAWIFITLATIGVMYGAYVTLKQKDLKYINAFSSVSHTGMVLFAILMFNAIATTGAVIQMVSHGLMTALFFALIGMIYSRTHTRNIDEMQGLIKVAPFIGVAYIIGGLTSLGLPGLSGFVAEINIFVGSFQNESLFHRIVTVLVVSSIVVTAVYILRVVGKFLFGEVKVKEYLNMKDATWSERTVAITLIAAILVIGLLPFGIQALIQDSVAFIMNNMNK